VNTLSGSAALLRSERAYRARHFAPPPRLSVSQWADRYRKLSTEASAVGGQWHSFPWQREIMDVGSDPRFRRVIAMLPSQVAGKTEILLNHIGYSVDLDPCPQLLVEPTLDMCRAISKDRIDPMFRDTPRLSGKILESARREKEDTILAKAGPGWRLTFVGANAPSGLAMRPIRKLFCDEVDRFPPSAGEEGDPISVVEKRTTTFPNRLIYLTGSPTVAGGSRIQKEYDASDQRRWLVPCPHCQHRQSLEWGGPDDPFGVKWDRDPDGRPLPETAAYLCAGCGALIAERHKAAMNDAGAWVAAFPGRSIAGFQMTALPSLAITWGQLVQEWYDAQGQGEEIKVFLNTRLARCYEPPGEQMDPEAISREPMGTDAEGYALIPAAVGVLTLGVDVQGDRLEVLLTGFAAGEEAYHLGNWRLAGDPIKPEVWGALEALRTRVWGRVGGGTMRVRMTAIDSGAYTAAVTDYVRPRERSGVMATKGSSEYGKQLLTRPQKRTTKYRTLVWMVGTIAVKDVIFGRLRKVTMPGPGYQHFSDQIDLAFLKQYGAERRRPHRVNGQQVWLYEQIGSQRNEAIDLTGLSLVALYALGDPVRRSLSRRPEAAPAPAMVTPEAQILAATEVLPVKQVRRPAFRKPGWVDSWR
jgi:phage terminase large subunit GpA-like protein